MDPNLNVIYSSVPITTEILEAYSIPSSKKNCSKILFIFGDCNHLKYRKYDEPRLIFRKKRFNETIICGPFDRINTFGIPIYFWNEKKDIPTKGPSDNEFRKILQTEFDILQKKITEGYKIVVPLPTKIEKGFYEKKSQVWIFFNLIL